MDLDEIESPDQFQISSENYKEVSDLEGFLKPENVNKISEGQDIFLGTKTKGLMVEDVKLNHQDNEILDWKELEQLLENKTAIIIGAILTALVLLCMVLNVFLAIKLCKKRSQVGTSSFGQMGIEQQGNDSNGASAGGSEDRNGESVNHFRAAELLSSNDSRFNNRDRIQEDILLNQI